MLVLDAIAVQASHERPAGQQRGAARVRRGRGRAVGSIDGGWRFTKNPRSGPTSGESSSQHIEWVALGWEEPSCDRFADAPRTPRQLL